MEDKKIYVVLTQTYSGVAKTIKFVTGKKYSHASISFDKSCNTMYSFGRFYTNLPLPGGFVVEDINRGLFVKSDEALIAIYEVEVTSLQYFNIKKRIFEIGYGSDGYNLIGLFLAYLNIKLYRNKFYCSEFVYEVLSSDGVNIFDQNDVRIQPEELVDSEYFNKIYEGKIKDYKLTL